ncbi:hypothetical protein RND81_06G161900 [Saponaria officinalis]|uniref:SKI-interacting protein SKIP SNW domain-containing protein n=1 Tax=Saponaria officinalis TaxID=3572 RepID=A0AAW1KCG6_SAPOF
MAPPGKRLQPKLDLVVIAVNVPSYLNRHGFIPHNLEDFGDGGAFREIHSAQFPLGMGRKESKSGSKILPVTVDSQGNLAFDAVVRQGENASKTVYFRHSDLVPKILKCSDDEIDFDEEAFQKEVEETMEATKAAIEEIVIAKLGAAQPKSSECKFIKYKPSQQSRDFNSGAKERIIRVMEMPVDPLEPPKFKHKKVPKGSGSPPVPVLHSPPRPVTVEDQRDWKIPPCVSNWKNSKGYIIPLDKRLAVDGRGLQEVQINDRFAELAEALCVTEQMAREVVALRFKVQKEIVMKEKERRNRELKVLAAKALSEKEGFVAPLVRESEDEREGRLEREKMRVEMRKERVRENRSEARDESVGKKRRITQDRDRDISEKVALGMASVGGAGSGEVVYDQRLFNQEKGMDSGFGTDDRYDVYDKGLFTSQATLLTLYQPKKDVDADVYGAADEQLEKMRTTKRFKPDREFTGTPEKGDPRDRAVEYEQEAHAEEADPFGLNQWFTEVKTGKKAMDGVGGSSR